LAEGNQKLRQNPKPVPFLLQQKPVDCPGIDPELGAKKVAYNR
jgi:hypothetical protein